MYCTEGCGPAAVYYDKEINVRIPREASCFLKYSAPWSWLFSNTDSPLIQSNELYAVKPVQNECIYL
jgi:hypothetical protein